MTHPIKCHVRAEGGVTRIDVFDDIGGGWLGEGLTAKSFGTEMASIKGPLDIHINSGGGSVSDGIAIANAIRAHNGPKRTIVDGMAASIASVIMQAGDERIIEPGAMVMIHDAWSEQPVGNEESGRRIVESLRKHSENIAGLYAERAGGTAEDWRAVMREETWFTAEEAVEAGLADRVGTGAAALPQRFDLAAFHAVPGRIVNAMRSLPTIRRGEGGTPVLEAPAAAAGHCPSCGGSLAARNAAPEGDRPIGDGWVMGADGKPRFDPDGDGDDDATPEGDSDHDYFDESGKQIKPIPPMPKTGKDGKPKKAKKAKAEGRIRNADVDNSAWDASKAWHNGATADDPAAFYAGICAGKKSGDPATQAGWALPYKYHPDDPPNAAGVRAALSRLPQTQGLINKTEATKTLESAMKKVNPDYSPDDLMEPGLLSAALLQALKGGTK